MKLDLRDRAQAVIFAACQELEDLALARCEVCRPGTVDARGSGASDGPRRLRNRPGRKREHRARDGEERWQTCDFEFLGLRTETFIA